MKKRYVFLAVLAVLLVCFPVVGAAKNDPKKDVFRAMPNLSFPLITTDVIQVLYQQTWVDSDEDGEIDDSEWIVTLDEAGNPIPIEVEEVINPQYTGSYPGNDDEMHTAYVLDPVTGCAVDVNEDGVVDDSDMTETPMVDWLQDMAPWYPQPVETSTTDPNLIWNAEYVDAANSWQADWESKTDAVVNIDFIDWGNPLENINPLVGYRFPVEVALYEKLETPMTAYKMACLEYPGTKVELFGTSTNPGSDAGSFTYGSYFATVLTTKFTAEVWNPDGTITNIVLGPGIGPSGKMNFASGNGGWTPTMPGWHRIWLHVNDPLIDFTGAIVNNDEHYIMSTGCMAQELNQNKQDLVGIIGDSTYIDVLVERPNGGGGGKKSK